MVACIMDKGKGVVLFGFVAHYFDNFESHVICVDFPYLEPTF
jgi:hypothetical protein